ncbi:PREDICTED: elongation of very long chain fatty acids protein 4-like isoform X2 [Papilio polytes]|uniref:elongation of very long chain fatty acids protein 4-like isoform X2 n=1 Tax=Papilio polytes TaxID=76194 RepID=UPI000676696C|nr:PREDICTED: elongation of very long chain fatty acids protein 4-like isoform X2 [Papilio polytes]
MDIYATWTLAQTLTAAGSISVLYLLIVIKFLPSYMKNRKPYNLKSIIFLYNVVQVLLSAYNFYLFVAHTLQYGLFPSKCWYEANMPMMKSILEPIMWYFIAKHLDLLDTIFFVLRKKFNQVTFLHVYHHFVMATWGWIYYIYFPTDIYLFVAMINCFVHVIMYTYYALACLGPEYAKYIWWKKYLTTLQLTQFLLIICYLVYQNKTSPCSSSDLRHWYGVGSIAIFFILFMNFYIRSYFTKKIAKDK